jgi:hypothetical protein
LQLIFLLEARKRRFEPSERQLLSKLHGYEAEKQNHRRWYVVFVSPSDLQPEIVSDIISNIDFAGQLRILS